MGGREKGIMGSMAHKKYVVSSSSLGFTIISSNMTLF